MKPFKLLVLLFLIASNISAQYKKFKIQKPYPGLEITQIDFLDSSTLVHMRFVCNSVLGTTIYIDDNFYIQDNQTNKKYKLLNSFNIPLASNNKYAHLEELNQTINFTLEFEKLPESAENLDLIENLNGNGFNVLGVKIDKAIKEDGYLDITSSINSTPIKEMLYYYNEGKLVQLYEDNGLRVALILSFDKSYGKYIQANISIQNTTGKPINFDPAKITAKIGAKKGEDATVLGYSEYMKKVKRRQGWSAFAVAFGEGMAASNAGYSNSTTTSTAVVSSKSVGSASGYSGHTYNSVSGSSRSYSTVYGQSYTQSYNAGAAYQANQQANKNVADFSDKQDKIKQTLDKGYMKLNTIMNESEYVGFVNIVYKKTDGVLINVPVNGKSYLFTFSF